MAWMDDGLEPRKIIKGAPADPAPTEKMQQAQSATSARVEVWLPASVRKAGVDRVLRPGAFLFRADAPTMGLFEVMRGEIKLTRVDRSGRETVLYIAGKGDIVAEASLFSPLYHCDARAISDAIVRLYPRASLLVALAENPKAAQAFMAMLAREIMSLRTKLQQRSIHSARERIRHHLSLNVGIDGRTFVVRGTLKDLASELGLTHEALYRALAEMADAGEIARVKGKIKLKSI